MALSHDFVEEMKLVLLKEKESLESQLLRFAKPKEGAGGYETKFEDIGPDADENASEVEMYADNIALEDNLEQQLGKVVAALERIEKGTYGMCLRSGKEIGEDRLRAFPAAETALGIDA